MKRNGVAWAALVVSTAALLSSQRFSRPLPAAQEIPAEGQKAARALSEAFGSVAESMKPSVVQISVERKGGMVLGPFGRGGRAPGLPRPGNPRDGMTPKDFEDLLKRFFPDLDDVHPEHEQFAPHGPQGPQGTGSGFVYDDKGHILTNNHVVADAKKITVTFYDGQTAVASVVGTDPETDVAVIKVDATTYPPAPRGRSKGLKVGEWVLAIGSPFGLSQTVTAGIVSATERNQVGINEYEAFIQTDAAINPGNSGGPLVDLSGRVIGINSAIVTGSRSFAGVGFAIPIDMAANLAEKLVKDGKVNKSRLGTVLQPLSPALAKQLGLDSKTKGVLINRVIEGSPADKAGLKPGDVLTQFEGESIVNVPSFRNQVATSDPGKSYSLSYLREGKEQKTSVLLVPAEEVDRHLARAEKPATGSAKPAVSQTEFKDFGLGVQPLTPELTEQFGYAKGAEGVVVASVKDGSPAQDAGLQVGDLISKVVVVKKIQPVKAIPDLQAAIEHGDEVALYVERGDEPGRFVTLSKSNKK